eukprot:797492-Rhodomonas_salina.1
MAARSSALGCGIAIANSVGCAGPEKERGARPPADIEGGAGGRTGGFWEAGVGGEAIPGAPPLMGSCGSGVTTEDCIVWGVV